MQLHRMMNFPKAARWTASVPGLVLALAVAMGGCQPADRQARDAATPPAFIFARGADAQKLDPADIDDGESVNSLAQVLEGLLGFAPDSLEVVPVLAESYSVSADGRQVTFRLREGVVFHDGTPLNAGTARFSFDRQMDPAHPAHFPDASFQYWQNLFSAVERIETVDAMTLRFHLSRPNAGFLSSMASFPAWLVSPGAFARYGAEMIRHPVGTGPYRFVSWRPGEAILYERNESYWQEQRPGFERMVLRPIPLNSSRLSELITGRIHGLDGVQPAELAALRDDPRFAVLHQPGMNIGYLAFSQLSPRLQDADLRRAIAMAIDRAALVRMALDGYGTVAAYPAPAGFLGIPADEGPIRHDVEAARALAAAHPHWRERPLTIASFNHPRMYFPDPARVASLIRSDLERIGLRVEILNREFSTHLHHMRRGDFELGLLGWIADTPDPDNFLGTFFHSRAAVSGSATNISFYRNPAMDALLDAATQTSDPVLRAGLYRQVLNLWAADLPLIPLVQAGQIVVLDARVGGYSLHPSGNHFFHRIQWRPAAQTADATLQPPQAKD